MSSSSSGLILLGGACADPVARGPVTSFPRLAGSSGAPVGATPRVRGAVWILGLVVMGSLVITGPAHAGPFDGIANTKHNLSASGPGQVKSSSEQEICIFCHSSHNATSSRALWNRELSTRPLLPYTSETLDADIAGQASSQDLATRMCLSCHDGTLAPASPRGRGTDLMAPLTPLGGRSVGKSRGLSMQGSHPVGFEVTDSLIARNNAKDAPLAGLAQMRADPEVKLDPGGRLQCTTCHDAHSDRNRQTSGVPFFNKSNVTQACRVCHLVPSAPGHMDENVMTRGCASCHLGHGAAGSYMLPATGEQVCLQCHGGRKEFMAERVDGRVAAGLRDVSRDFQKPARHPIETAGLHRKDEALPERDPGTPRHVSCLDCHGPHDAALGSRGYAQLERPGKRGQPLQHLSCYDCHGDSANRPALSRNIQRLMNPASASSHPVESPLTGSRSVSLRPDLKAEGSLTCMDCHGGDDPQSASAPHGSRYSGLLRYAYTTRDREPESALAYSLCYQCHDRGSILRDQSFAEHRSHVARPDIQTSCHTCHNSHGSVKNPWLIEFDPTVVGSTATGQLSYRQLAPRQSECFLSCHNVEHAPGRACPPDNPCDKGVIRSMAKAVQSMRQRQPLAPQETPSLFDDTPMPGGF